MDVCISDVIWFILCNFFQRMSRYILQANGCLHDSLNEISRTLKKNIGKVAPVKDTEHDAR